MPKTYNTFTNVSTGDVLTATTFNNVLTNIESYRVPPAVRAKRSGDLTGYTGGAAIAWNAEDYDTDGMHDNSSNTERLTVQTSGIYLVQCGLRFEYTGTLTDVDFIIRQVTTGPTTTSISNVYLGGLSNAGVLYLTQSTIISAVAGDYFTVGVNGTGGSALIIKADARSHFTATWLGQTS